MRHARAQAVHLDRFLSCLLHVACVSVTDPLLRLREEGADAFALGPRHGKFTGKHGYPKAADRVIDDVSAADVDCVIVPGEHPPRSLVACPAPELVWRGIIECGWRGGALAGGWAPDYWRRDPRFTGLIKDCVESGKVVAAICHGTNNSGNRVCRSGCECAGVRLQMWPGVANVHVQLLASTFTARLRHGALHGMSV